MLLQFHRLSAWLPSWLIAVIALVVTTAIAFGVHAVLMRIALRLVPERHDFVRSLLAATRGLSKAALAIVMVALLLPALAFDEKVEAVISRGLIVAFILLIGWAAIIAVSLASDLYLRRSTMVGDQFNPMARKHVTQVRVLRRVATIVVGIVTVSVALMTFNSVRQYGVSLIASAGAASIVVGLAVRPILTNLFAGIQLAITQPIRIDDAVIVENEWGWVEEITGTYVVIKIWDWRRLIVPLSYFLEKPFQNWTRQTTDLIGSVLLWVDYTVPIAAVRSELEKIARASKLWDGNVVNLQVVDSNERAIQLRALVSARTSPEAWDLRCEVREKLILFLQRDYPGALPKQRAELVDLPKRDAAA
ncbi:MAG TPA: mechanosensitive ion channel domain-containing protein [Reyranella sp.]|nr:mechanosensitive ion channel domain-containing protein [Reyranella sp.]